ncbi:acetyl esterase [Chryseobacterium bernardetii]|uniref:Acetyl esterase n=2 Tax=Chryseobacterium TaxID=59732 RepID=A0A543EJ02_9FLAO|nr:MULTISPECIES: alpha/beta hydrolase [Chryseobacterium]MDR6370002.1 acetyl esterase [Chryseobacterium vietnamense]MDR6440755.1 acetyl esterase [Chryseobacterium bernardetii]TQM21564.1 acetyl esterase [Chryseobacterium aquifrigidense]
MQLTPKITQILNHLETIQPFNPQDSLDGARKFLETMSLQLSGKKEAVAVIEELHIPQENHQIPVRIYRPKGKEIQQSSAIIYIHGGWFIAGGYETHDAVVRKLANKTGSVVIFIDYRLAPEHPFPAGLNDSLDSIKWVIENAESLGIDPDKIGIIGDSAGAALATAVSTQIGKHLKFQVLIYPAVDNQLNSKTWETYENGPVLNKQGGIEAWAGYLPEEEKENPLAIPVLIKAFKETPSTFIILAEHDPLLDDGKQLSENMKNAGVDITISFYKDMVHGFMHMGELLEEVQSAVDEMAAFAHQNLKSGE